MDDVDQSSMNNGITFGDYVPKECLAENQSTRTWLAEQTSVGRMVLVEELKKEAIHEREAFLADVRAKAAVEHPLVGSIYEASTEDGHCYFAHELLPGETLQQKLSRKEVIKAQNFVQILRKISEANIYHESHDNATSPLDLGAVHVDRHGVIRVQNLVIAGSRLPNDSLRDVLTLGSIIEPLLDQKQPGTTRCLTLLAWMRGEETSKPLGWEQIRDYCEQIEQQLTEPSSVVAPPTSAIRPEKKNGFVWVILILLLAAFAGVFAFSKRKKPAAPNIELPGLVEIDGGKYRTPDGLSLKIAAFRISAHEVTIGEYSKFLETLEILAKSNEEKSFDHPEQPKTKVNHLPDDWSNLLGGAKIASSWKGRAVDIFTPVVGIDWWDAYAFATWQKSSLPTQEQWLSALMAGAKVPATVEISNWLPVTAATPDRTSNGILGLAGSVAEWTSEARPSPSNPLGESLWVIAGGSYLRPAKGAMTREWVQDRSLRRPDLGFRICREAK